jgi:hypothetical protein
MEFFASSLSDPADSQVEDHGIFTDCYGLRINRIEREQLLTWTPSNNAVSLLNTAAIDFLQQFRLPAKDSLKQ